VVPLTPEGELRLLQHQLTDRAIKSKVACILRQAFAVMAASLRRTLDRHTIRQLFMSGDVAF